MIRRFGISVLFLLSSSAAGLSQTSGTSLGLTNLRTVNVSTAFDTISTGGNKGAAYLPTIRLTRALSASGGIGCTFGIGRSRFVTSAAAAISASTQANTTITGTSRTYYAEPFVYQQWRLGKYELAASAGIPVSVITGSSTQIDYAETNRGTGVIDYTESNNITSPANILVGINATALFQRKVYRNFYIGPAFSFLVGSGIVSGDEVQTFRSVRNGVVERDLRAATSMRSFETYMTTQFSVYCSYYFRKMRQ